MDTVIYREAVPPDPVPCPKVYLDIADILGLTTENERYINEIVLSVVCAFFGPASLKNIKLVKSSAKAASPDPGRVLAAYKVGFGFILACAKEINIENAEFLARRWKAVSASLLKDGITVDEDYTMSEVVIQIVARLRSKIVMLAVVQALEGNIPTDPIISACFLQVKLIYNYQGMGMLMRMYNYLSMPPNLAIVLPAVASRASQFSALYKTIKAAMGPIFPYARLVDPNGLSHLDSSKFPDLYYATFETEMQSGNLGTKGRHKMSDHTTIEGKDKLRKFVRTPLADNSTITEETEALLAALGIGIEPAKAALLKIHKHKKRKAREISSSSESEGD